MLKTIAKFIICKFIAVDFSQRNISIEFTGFSRRCNIVR